MTSVHIRGAPRATDFRIRRSATRAITGLLAIIGAAAVASRTANAQQPVVSGPAGVAGPVVRLTLDEALRLALMQSQTVEVARAGVTRATGQRIQARSQYLPQLTGTAGYTRTLKSQFSALASSSSPETTVVVPTTQSLCTPPIAANATADQRAAALAQAASCVASTGGGGLDFSKTSFGAANQYAFGLNFSQNVFTGGRVEAQNKAAEATLRSANIEVSAQRAQVSLDVTQAYYDAVLADQLVTIADSSLAQTSAILQQTTVSRQVGNSSEFDLLRAQVTRDNQLPVLIQARSNRDVAYLRLKQLLNMPLDNALQLTSSFDESTELALPASVAGLPIDTVTNNRAAVREINENVIAQEAQVKIARAERIPALALVSAYQRLYFPSNLFPSISNGVNNWTVGLSTSLPILDGGRIKGDIVVAQAGLEQARAQRDQTRQFAALDARVALSQLQQAQATWDASRGTADQAQRAYAIDQVRFREGISTQTDLTQSRLLLEQSKANRAQAARNLAVARAKLALLRDLPLQTTGTSAAATASQQQQQQSQQQTQQQQGQSTQQRSTTTSTSATTGGTGSGQP